MARYRLDVAHLWADGRLLDPGTVVGDGTPWTVDEPTLDMTPLDRDALRAVRERFDKLEPDAPGRRPPPSEFAAEGAGSALGEEEDQGEEPRRPPRPGAPRSR